MITELLGENPCSITTSSVRAPTWMNQAFIVLVTLVFISITNVLNICNGLENNSVVYYLDIPGSV